MDKKSVIAFTIAPIIVSAFGFVFTPLLSWWLAESDMAKFAMFQTNVNFFTLIVSLGLDQALAREFHEAASPARLLGAVLKLVLLAVPVGLIALVVIKFNVGGLASASITPAMAAACVLLLLNRMYASFIRMSGNGVAYAIDIVTPKVLQLAIIGLIFSHSLIALSYDVVVGIFAASAAAALVYEICMSRRIGRSLEAEAGAKKGNALPSAAALLKFSMPLVPGAFAYYAISASAIYIVGAHGDSREVVTTSLAISIGGGLAVIQSIFSTLWSPFAYRWHAQRGDPSLYGDIATLVTMGCLLILLCSMLVAPYLVLLFPGKYDGVPRLLILVIVWNLLYLISIVGSFGIGVKRMSLTSMTISLGGAAISIGLSSIASRYYGALGALLSVLGAFVVTLVLNCELSTKGWQRVVGAHHYAMVAVMAAAGVMFSLGYRLQAELLLVLAIVYYFATFRPVCVRVYGLFRGAGKKSTQDVAIANADQ